MWIEHRVQSSVKDYFFKRTLRIRKWCRYCSATNLILCSRKYFILANVYYYAIHFLDLNWNRYISWSTNFCNFKPNFSRYYCSCDITSRLPFILKKLNNQTNLTIQRMQLKNCYFSSNGSDQCKCKGFL